MFFSQEDVDRLIFEDAFYFDLTKEVLNINTSGKIEFFSRKEGVVSSVELVEKIAKTLELDVLFKEVDGKLVEKGSKIFEARGKRVLEFWKVAQNVFEYAMSVSTYVYKMKEKAKKYNPNIEILTTRKVIPFSKKVALKAVLDGGGFPHRITTSETILVFDNYINLYGGWDKFFKEFAKLKNKSVEKNWVVECKDLEMAKKLIELGVDVIQLDKVDVKTTEEIVKLASKNKIKVLSAGGINLDNVEEYAKIGVDGIVTTAPYFAKGGDIKVVITA